MLHASQTRRFVLRPPGGVVVTVGILCSLDADKHVRSGDGNERPTASGGAESRQHRARLEGYEG